MRSLLKTLGKGLTLLASAAAGVALALLLFANIMIVKVEGTTMLPALEPGQKLVVLRQAEEVRTGDLVVYEAPYYTIDGEGLRKVRRVTGSRGEWLRLDCDVDMTEDSQVLVRREEILGKAVFNLSNGKIM